MLFQPNNAVNVHDVTKTSELMLGEEKTVSEDGGYIGAEKREDAVIWNKAGKKIRYNKPAPEPAEIAQQKQAIQGQETETRKILNTGESRACFRHSERPAQIQENPIPRTTKTGSKVQHHVHTGKSDTG